MSKPALKITLVYLTFGIVWILLSDKILNVLIFGNSDFMSQNIFRGWGFLIISTVLIFLLVNYALGKERKSKIRKDFEKELEEKRCKIFFDYINDAAYVYELNPDNISGKFLDVNQKMVEQLGYSKEELLQMHPYDILAPGLADMMKRNELQLIKNKHHYLETDHINNAGKKFPVEVSLHLFEMMGSRLVFGTVKDIREQKKYIRKLRKAKEKAEESDRLKSAFLENMSHEIRTPMNGIIGFSELIIQDDIDKEEKANYSNLIKRSTDQLLSIVNDILDISRIETAQMILIETDCSLNKIMDELQIYLKNKLAKRENKLEVICTKYLSDGNDIIVADQVRLQQVLINLVNNAAKFTLSGSIEYGYSLKEGSILEFYVKDTGIGIPQDKQSLVFERFRQVDDSNTRKYGGTGLGLPIAKGIIEKMNGEIRIDSIVEKGTTMMFTIPYKKSESLKIQEEIKISIEKADFSDKTVMIVEDNLENLLLLEEISKFFKLNVIKAFNGNDAIKYVNQNNNIHLIFMDIRLPDISGFEVTRTIKNLISVPIVAQTAYVSLEDKAKCLAAGCDDYISKPINRDEISKILVKYLS